MSDLKIITPSFMTSLDLPAEKVLTAALEADLAHVIVIGMDKTGEVYLASTYGDPYKTYYWLDNAKYLLPENE